MKAAEDFDKIDFDVYKSRYPNFTSVIFAIILLIIFSISIVVFTIYFIKGNEINKRMLCIIFAYYVPSFLGLWIYSIVIYAKDFKDENLEIAKGIRADKYIEDFLNEFYSPFEKTGFILFIIILLSFSVLLFVALFLIEPLFECIEERRKASLERVIVYSNQNNTRNNNDNDNNKHQQLNTDNGKINSNRELNENIKQSEANVNKADNKAEVKVNNEILDIPKNNENNGQNLRQDFNTIAVEESNK